MNPEEYTGLARRLHQRWMRPERPRLAQARAVLGPRCNAREAWERLATHELIPGAWLDEPRRTFQSTEAKLRALGIDPHTRPRFRFGYSVMVASPVPATGREAALFGGDAPAVEQAEELAREHVARCHALSGFGGPCPAQTVLWSVVDAQRASNRYYFFRAPPGLLAARAAVDAVRLASDARPPLADALAGVYNSAANLASLECAWRWARAAEQGLRVSAGEWVPAALVGRPFAELPDPYRPLADLEALGYLLLSASDLASPCDGIWLWAADPGDDARKA